MQLANEFSYLAKRLPDVRIIHVGAHQGEEAEFYRDALGASRVVWVEGNEAIFAKLQAHLAKFTGHVGINAMVADREDDAIFYLSNNNQCSSLLDMKDTITIYSKYGFRHIRTIPVKTTTLDRIVENLGEKFNVLAMDIQGAEHLALAGAKNMLQDVQLIATEVNYREMYVNCVMFDDMVKILAGHGFTCYAADDTGFGWGEALFIR